VIADLNAVQICFAGKTIFLGQQPLLLLQFHGFHAITLTLIFSCLPVFAR